MCVQRLSFLLLCMVLSTSPLAADNPPIAELLQREIIGPDLALAEVENYCEAKVPVVPRDVTRDQWEALAAQWRRDMLDKVVLRGEATAWKSATSKVEWFDVIESGAGYRIKKLRYEALPGLWIPALLYEPDNLIAPAPVMLNVNGHDGNGKAAPYKQIRCINQAKRGILALNVEWLGMGQLATSDFMHYRMNQLDLCGTSGLAPFYLAMQRGLDVLLAHEFADPDRVAVAGLSGGGWQTIFISSLDKRVTLTNPVAGYSSFRTRIRNHSDLGDSEQTPCDMATVADYAHLTAMMAPRATLLTYNIKDNCCFASDHALPPLLDAAEPVFKLYGKIDRLRSHVNYDPGTHNFDQDNRQALYRMLGATFYPDDTSFSAVEIPSESEVKTKDELNVDLPSDNLDFHQLAARLSQNLPVIADLPEQPTDQWFRSRREQLRDVLRAQDYSVVAAEHATESIGDLRVTFWRLRIGDAWTVPAVEFARGEPKQTAIVIADAGRGSQVATVQRLLEAQSSVLAVDPFYIGESKIKSRDFLFALLVSAVGDRPVGLQAGQLAGIARWLKQDRSCSRVTIVADGERLSLAALAAAGLEHQAIDRIELRGSLGSLKEVIERNYSVNEKPEFFCFGLLKSFDIRQLTALVAPREVQFVEPSDRAKADLATIPAWYAKLNHEFNPVGSAGPAAP